LLYVTRCGVRHRPPASVHGSPPSLFVKVWGMPVGGEPGSAVLNPHAHVVRALIASAGEGESPSPYVVLRLAEHVATAGAWDDLAAAPYLLDQLDPDSVAIDAATPGCRPEKSAPYSTSTRRP